MKAHLDSVTSVSLLNTCTFTIIDTEHDVLWLHYTMNLQKREEDERSIQELLEQNAQLELEKQRM